MKSTRKPPAPKPPIQKPPVSKPKQNTPKPSTNKPSSSSSSSTSSWSNDDYSYSSRYSDYGEYVNTYFPEPYRYECLMNYKANLIKAEYINHNKAYGTSKQEKKKINWWEKNKKVFAVVGAAVGVTAVIALSGRLAAPMIIGAAVGFTASAGIDVGMQLKSNGGKWEDVNYKQSLVSGSIGMVSGAVGGTTLGLAGQVLTNTALGGASTLASDFVNGTQSSLLDYGYNMTIGGISGAFGPGAQNVPKLTGGSIARYTIAPNFRMFSSSASAATKATVKAIGKSSIVNFGGAYLKEEIDSNTGRLR